MLPKDIHALDKNFIYAVTRINVHNTSELVTIACIIYIPVASVRVSETITDAWFVSFEDGAAYSHSVIEAKTAETIPWKLRYTPDKGRIVDQLARIREWYHDPLLRLAYADDLSGDP